MGLKKLGNESRRKSCVCPNFGQGRSDRPLFITV